MPRDTYVSATQLKETRSGCWRKWGFAYILGLKQPPSPAMQFGTDVHTQLENWLSKGDLPDESKEGIVAKQGIQKDYLPPPDPSGERLKTEFKFDGPMADGVRILGYIDVVDRESKRIIDHKTTSDMRYALNDESIKTDVQAMIYGYVGLALLDTDEIDVRWVYYASDKKTRKPKGVKKVEAHFTKEYLEPQWGELVETALEMRKHRLAKTDPLELPPNTNECNAYGGCPFRDRCNITTTSPGKTLAGHLAQFEKTNLPKTAKSASIPAKVGKDPKMSSLMAKMKANKSKKSNGAPPPAPAKAKGVNPPEAAVDPATVPEPAVSANKPAAAKKGGPRKTYALGVEEGYEKAKAEFLAAGGEAAQALPITPVEYRAPFSVFLNCAPIKGEDRGQLLSEFVAPIAKKVATANKVHAWNTVDYGKGPGLLAALLAKELEENKPEGIILVDTSTPMGNACAEVLVAYADVVVR